jgi:hypothetical protein
VFRFQCCPHRQEVQENNTLLISKGYSHEFFLLTAHSEIYSPLEMLCGAIPSIAAWIPRFQVSSLVKICNTSCTAQMQNSCGNCFSSLFVGTPQHSWHTSSKELGTAKLFNKWPLQCLY